MSVYSLKILLIPESSVGNVFVVISVPKCACLNPNVRFFATYTAVGQSKCIFRDRKSANVSSPIHLCARFHQIASRPEINARARARAILRDPMSNSKLRKSCIFNCVSYQTAVFPALNACAQRCIVADRQRRPDVYKRHICPLCTLRIP